MKMRLFSCLLFLVSAAWMNVFAQPTDEDLLKLFKGLRVADVSDGMDLVGLKDVGLMSPSIEALWKDTENFTHWVYGIAVTARYVPTNKVFPTNLSPEEYNRWVGSWYNTISPEPFVEHIKPGTFLVFDNAGDGDTGSTGSANIMNWKSHGAVGLVSAGGVRDTDEISKQKNPVYMDISKRGRGIRPGRNEIESVQKPVVVGGVLVHPGDVIVADGDGVIVVPREKAVSVAEAAHRVLQGDKADRQALYQKLGLPLDFTVQ